MMCFVFFVNKKKEKGKQKKREKKVFPNKEKKTYFGI